MIGAYRSITRSPPSSASASRNDGIDPRMTSRMGGNASMKNTPAGSRKNSFVSVSVRRDRADTKGSSVVDRAAGERDERVVQRGLFQAQVRGDDLVAGECGGDGEQQVAGAGDDQLAACSLDRHDLGQRGQQRVVDRGGRAEPQ